MSYVNKGYIQYDAHLNWHVELILAPMWSETGSGGMDWYVCGLAHHLREPYFQHDLYLQQVVEIFLTAGKRKGIK